MSIFRNMAATARTAHNHFFGVTATLVEPGTSARQVPVVLGKVTIETRREDNREVRVAVRDCRFPTLAAVRHDAVVTIGSLAGATQWTIDTVVDRQASGFAVILRRAQVHDVSRPTYRGKG